MTALHELQARWRQAALAGDPAAQADPVLPDPVLVAAVRADGIAPLRRLGVHRNHLTITLTEALAATFPTLRALVGEDFFAGLARRFIRAHPPQTPCLFEYGAALPGFLCDSGLAAGLPCLPDVAALDWAVNAVYHAEDAPGFDHDAFARLAPEQYGRLRFAFVPALALLSSDWPLAEIWRAAQPDAPADQRVDLDGGPCRLAVHRADWDVVWRELSAAEAGVLAALQAGEVLAAAVAQAPEDPNFDLGGLLGWAVQADLLAGFEAAEAG